MSVSFLAASAATIVAAVVTGILVRRLFRLPRLDQAAWACAATGLTVALAAQALGYRQGFNAAAFRAIQVGARLAAPMALIWGLVELTGKSFGVRFGARLALAALTAIAGVILASDPLSGVTFTTAWPTAATHYQFIPNVVLVAIAAATMLPALIALAVAAVRARREPGWREAFPAVAAAAAAALLTQALQVRLPVNFGYAAICLIAVVLTWFAGQRSSRLQLTALHESGEALPSDDTWGGRDDTWGGRYTDGSGYGAYRAGTSGPGRVSTDSDFAGLYRADTGGPGRSGGGGRTGGGGRSDDDSDVVDVYRTDTGGFGEISSDTGYGFYRTDTDLRPVVNGGPDLPRGEPVPGVIETGDILPVTFDVFTPLPRGTDGQEEEETARLYGQIAIYTLIDGQAEEFDRLAQAVVEKVKALEPDTLAYIVHGVPSAPMQRILYEVYRDEAAFIEHGQQTYIQDFEEERKPYLLATNVIELGVRQAKLSPLSGGASGQPSPAGRTGTPSQLRQAAPHSPPGPPDPYGRPAPSGPPGRPPPSGPPSPSGRPAPSGPPPPSGRPAPPGPPPPSSRPAPSGRPAPPGPPPPSSRAAPSGRPAPSGRLPPSGQPAPGSWPAPSGPPGPFGQPAPYGQPVRPGPPGPNDQHGPPVPPDGQPARRRSNGTR